MVTLKNLVSIVDPKAKLCIRHASEDDNSVLCWLMTESDRREFNKVLSMYGNNKVELITSRRFKKERAFEIYIEI